uniref:uncharacterized protein LOC120338060 n=1 Tax=Styela clava TaxID=7725 RepID=UPI00193991D1
MRKNLILYTWLPILAYFSPGCWAIYNGTDTTTAIAKNGTVSFDNTITSEEFLKASCVGKNVSQATYKKNCCNYISNSFRLSWSVGGQYLTEYLSNLQDWGCEEFEKECENPIYDYTNFTRIVYVRFCNRFALLAKCTEELHKVTKKYNFYAIDATYGSNDALEITDKIWNNLTSSIIPTKMDMKDLLRPCVQIALFDRPSGGVGRYHEIVQPYVPFCTMPWDGYDIETAMTRHVSPWTSMSLWCRGSTIAAMVVTGILGAAIIIANLTILSVYISSPKLRNSQAVFKMSIATGDLLSGVIVLPNVIVFQHLMFIHERLVGETIDGEIERRQAGGSVRSIIPSPYINFVGFFTTLSLSLSIYTLLLASFDRFWAIFRPLKYSKTKAKIYAQYTCLGVWIFAILIAIIPLLIPSLQYMIILAVMVTSVGVSALILVGTAFAIPMIALCAINCATFRSAQRHARVRQRLQSTRGKKSNEELIETRLRKILGLMVGVFVACIFPTFFLTILAIFFDNILFRVPEKLNPEATTIFQTTQYCAILVLLSNSLWNCFIYSSRGEEFCNAAKTLKFVKVVTSAASYVAYSARRLSEAPNYYRRKSSSASTGSALGTHSSKTTRLPSLDSSSVFAHDSSVSTTSANTHRGT